MKLLELLKKLGLLKENGVYYIGGSDILPPPLKGAQEQEALEALERGFNKRLFSSVLGLFQSI